METVHCLTIGNDGLVYVCNRQNAKIQVYDKMGSLKRTIQVPWTTARRGRRISSEAPRSRSTSRPIRS